MVLQYHAGEYVAALFLERITKIVILFFRYRCGVSLRSIASPIRKLGSPPCFKSPLHFCKGLFCFIESNEYLMITLKIMPNSTKFIPFNIWFENSVKKYF